VEAELSIWALVSEASFVVQAVMLLLLLASVTSWILIFLKGIYLGRAKSKTQAFENEFWSGTDLREIYANGNERLSKGGASLGIETIFRSGFKEFNRLTKSANADGEMIMEGVQRAMRIAISREQDEIEKSLPFLASVASVSPYIGLFGTVWGIMNSFRGLGAVQQATLATVAPGIAEALVATAMGLFAAIPAVLAYNRYSASADSLSSAYGTFAEELSSVLHRNVASRAS